MDTHDPEAAFEESRLMDASPCERAEGARRAGAAAEAVRVAREALGQGEDAATRTALALALLDAGELDEARHTLEVLLETLGGEAHPAGFGGALPFASHPQGMIPDTTLAEATAATLELVDSLDDATFERAMDSAEAERELMRDADGVAEQVLREIPPELPDEVLPPPGSPFATRTFAELLERQGHEAEAESLRSVLSARPLEEPASAGTEAGPGGTGPASKDDAWSDPVRDAGSVQRARALATLERWLENLGRTAA